MRSFASIGIPFRSFYSGENEYASDYDEKMDTFAKRVKARRDDLGLTQGQIADRSGIKQSDISKIENGGILRPAGILGLAKALQCDPEWLSTGDGEMLPNSYVARAEVGNYVRAQPETFSNLAKTIAEMFDSLPDDPKVRVPVLSEITAIILRAQRQQASLQPPQPESVPILKTQPERHQ